MSRFSSVDFSSSIKEVRDWLWMIPSQKGSLGTVSWWLDCGSEPVLIDCPEISVDLINDLKKLSEGSLPRIVLTNRNSHGNVSLLNKELGWPVLIQEQESYLLPEIRPLESFSEEAKMSSGLRVLWTPGPTPGSCVVYAPPPWNVLFCGRLLIPVAKDQISSVRTRMTFHWTMQKNSLKKLRQWIPSDPLLMLASGQGLHSVGRENLVPWKAWDSSEIG